jgi:hypothetical protein
VNKGKNFPSFQILSACCIIGKIHVGFAAGGAPVAVKRRTVNPVIRLIKDSDMELAQPL